MMISNYLQVTGRPSCGHWSGCYPIAMAADDAMM